jgi:aryl-alcohol dehydrogenase-like predicted oxidoreductase
MGIGGESLSSFLDRPNELFDFCRRAHDCNFEFIDTSPFYHNALIDAKIGRHVLPKIEFSVISKSGLPYVDLNTIRNRAARKLGKFDSKFRSESLGWKTGFTPQLLSKEITTSIKRLKQASHRTYLLHSVPEELNLVPFIAQLEKEKSLGRIDQIGASVDSWTEKNFDWADVLQVPTSLRQSPLVRNFKGNIIFFGVFRENGTNAYAVLEELVESFPGQSLVIGSRNIKHLLEVRKFIKGK